MPIELEQLQIKPINSLTPHRSAASPASHATELVPTSNVTRDAAHEN